MFKTNKSGVNSELSDFEFEVSSEIRNHVLPYVNKLCDYWILMLCRQKIRILDLTQEKENQRNGEVLRHSMV